MELEDLVRSLMADAPFDANDERKSIEAGVEELREMPAVDADEKAWRYKVIAHNITIAAVLPKVMAHLHATGGEVEDLPKYVNQTIDDAYAGLTVDLFNRYGLKPIDVDAVITFDNRSEHVRCFSAHKGHPEKMKSVKSATNESRRDLNHAVVQLLALWTDETPFEIFNDACAAQDALENFLS